MGEEEKKEKKRVVVESLGWLTESSIMPKKHRAIAGVGASSILELKAQLYRSQEESKKSKELSGADLNYHRAKSKISKLDTFSLKNTGVDARAHKYVLFPSSSSSSSYFSFLFSQIFLFLSFLSLRLILSQCFFFIQLLGGVVKIPKDKLHQVVNCFVNRRKEKP